MKKGDRLKVETYLGTELLTTVNCLVNWAIDDEIATVDTDHPGSYNIYNIKDPSYKFIMIQESAPHFQSQVEQMTDEELRASIENLRGTRSIPTPVKKAKVASKPTPPTKADMLEALRAKMTPEAFETLKAKMGL